MLSPDQYWGSALNQYKDLMTKTVKFSVADPNPDPDPPDPHVFGPPGSGSFYYQAKKVRKPLMPTALRLLLNFNL